MKKVQIKSEFQEEQENNEKEMKKTQAQCIKERMGECYEEKLFKIQVKRKKINAVKFQMLLTKTMTTLKEKNQRKHKQ